MQDVAKNKTDIILFFDLMNKYINVKIKIKGVTIHSNLLNNEQEK